MTLCRCADCDWTAEAPTVRLAADLLTRHVGEAHNDVPWMEDDRG